MVIVTKEVFDKVVEENKLVEQPQWEVEPYNTSDYVDADGKMIAHSRQYGYGGDTEYKVLEEFVK